MLSGQLRAFTISDDGKEITITAEKDTEALVIPSEVYKSIMEVSAPLANYTSEVMASRFSEVMWLIDQVMWKSFDKRLADFLLNEANIEGANLLKITHETIGNYLGNPREVVTRMLKYFVSEGLVTLSRGTIEIIGKDGLKRITDRQNKALSFPKRNSQRSFLFCARGDTVITNHFYCSLICKWFAS